MIPKIILFLLIVIPSYAAEHNQSLVLLTPDYGILSSKDILRYEQSRNVRPFDPKNSSNINYWQCFESKNVSINWRSWINDGWTRESDEEVCDIKIIVTLDSATHTYFIRRAAPVEYCVRSKAHWTKLMEKEAHVCLGGEYGPNEKPSSNSNEKSNLYWTFDMIKTHKGCDAYFGGSDGCS